LHFILKNIDNEFGGKAKTGRGLFYRGEHLNYAN
jgi:hypothetical protein